MPNMTHPAATTEDDWNNMKDAEEWDALRDEIDYHKADARKWANALDRANAELAKAAIQIADLCEEKEYAIRMCDTWRTDSEKLEALTIQLVKAQQQNNQRDWVAVIDALHKYGEAAMEWNEGDAPKVGAGDTANREQSLQKLGARLAELLDEDHFAECEAFLLAAGVKPYNAKLTGVPPTDATKEE